jgi:hypothetical protein
MTYLRARAALVACLLLLCQPAHASWRELLPDAQRVGQGELRFLGLAIYDAELWAAAPADAVALRTPFALQLSYRRSISRDLLVSTSLREIRRLVLPAPEPQQLQRWEQAMQQAFVDVRAGDRITGVFMPGEGARFYLGEQLHHIVTDPAFARAFFAIWLDARTRNPELRSQLLGRAEP